MSLSSSKSTVNRYLNGLDCPRWTIRLAKMAYAYRGIKRIETLAATPQYYHMGESLGKKPRCESLVSVKGTTVLH